MDTYDYIVLVESFLTDKSGDDECYISGYFAWLDGEFKAPASDMHALSEEFEALRTIYQAHEVPADDLANAIARHSVWGRFVRDHDELKDAVVSFAVDNHELLTRRTMERLKARIDKMLQKPVDG